MKRIIILFILLFVVTGCTFENDFSDVNILKYEGDDFIYSCTNDDIKLFESKVNVLLNQDQGFLSLEDGKWHEKINHEEDIKLEYSEKDNMEACYFINYENMNYKFGTQSPIVISDQEQGIVRFRMRGNYDYTIYNTEKFVADVLSTDNYEETMEQILLLVNREIISAYSNDVYSKSFIEIQKEKEFSKELLEKINSSIQDRFGIELTKVNIEEVEKVN